MFKKLPSFFISLTFLILLATKAHALELKINEVLPHPSVGNKEWIEFYNPEKIDLSTNFLDDDLDFNNDSGSSVEKQLTEINNSDPVYPYFECLSFLNNDGDFVVLFASNGEIIDQYVYESDPGIDIFLGRSPDRLGEITSLVNMTKGGANSTPPTFTPTNTPIPTSTPTLTPTSKPTLTLVKTQTIVLTKTPILTKTATVSIINPVNSTSFSNLITEMPSTESSILGSEISNLSTSSSTPIPTEKVEKEKKDGNLTALILISIGLIFLVSCAILGFLFYRKKHVKTNE